MILEIKMMQMNIHDPISVEAVDLEIDKFMRRTLTAWECGGCQKTFKNRMTLRNHVEV